MNDACNHYRESLHAHFDAGLDFENAAHDHAADCAECRAYRDQITAMNVALYTMPLEIPRNALAQRVKSQLAAESAYANDARWWLPAAAAFSLALLIGLTLYFAVPVDPWTWWNYASEPATTPAWMLGEVSFATELATVERYWGDFSTLFRSLSTPLWWAAAVFTTLILAGLNGAKAYRLRTASNRSVYQHTWR